MSAIPPSDIPPAPEATSPEPPSAAPLVSLGRQPDYSLPGLKDAIAKLLEPLGGMGKFVRPGDDVVLKLNLVCPTKGHGLAYTQPEVFQAVAELALDHGGRVRCGDSPGMSSAAKVAELAGIAPVAARLGVPVIEFTPKEVHDEKRVFKTLRLAKELLEADAVINLPRLKTHCQMMLTAAVKNLFGAVIGPEKFGWHYRAGSDYRTFARIIYEICMAVRPGLHILDAVRSMHGPGPTDGLPCESGFLAAGSDPVAIDATMMRILGRDPEELYTIQAAAAAGDEAWRNAKVVGVDDLAALRPKHWIWPQSRELAMIDARWLKWLPGVSEDKVRRWSAVFPAVQNGKCVQCGRCANLCSVKAITVNRPAPGAPAPKDKLTFDHSKCIRCYCCHELCPEHALELKGGWLGKALSLLNRWL